jgi:hypothetical protein
MVVWLRSHASCAAPLTPLEGAPQPAAAVVREPRRWSRLCGLAAELRCAHGSLPGRPAGMRWAGAPRRRPPPPSGPRCGERGMGTRGHGHGHGHTGTREVHAGGPWGGMGGMRERSPPHEGSTYLCRGKITRASAAPHASAARRRCAWPLPQRGTRLGIRGLLAAGMLAAGCQAAPVKCARVGAGVRAQAGQRRVPCAACRMRFGCSRMELLWRGVGGDEARVRLWAVEGPTNLRTLVRARPAASRHFPSPKHLPTNPTAVI